ncbi:hypothetical protein ABPG72_000366 [Tetrahymena utriculariae]
MNKYLAIILISITALSAQGVWAFNLRETRLSDLDQCFNNVKGTFQDLENIIKDITQLDFKKAFQQLGDLVKVLDKDIEKCADATCWMTGEKRCQNDNSSECEKWGLIWYPKCKQGYHPFGCCVCAQDCPSSFRDDGLYCAKPDAYGRGAGYPWKFGDGFNLNNANSRCLHDHPSGCEQSGAIIYPKCAQNFHSVGCCVCSPNCPSEMTDIGMSCQKLSYGRGVGYINGRCIEENWNNFTPIEKFGKCIDQAKQIVQDIQDLISSLNPQNDDQKWKTLKIVYQLLQHTNPFLVHCIDPLVKGIEEINSQ